MDYIDLDYMPSNKDLVAEYYVEPAKNLSLEQAAQHIAAESSIGTWTDIKTMSPRIATRLKPKVFFIDEKSRIVKIAYTEELFESGSISQLLSSIAGNIFGMKIVDNLRLIDVHFPKSYVNSFPGPKYGIPGVRKITRVKKRPLLGTIVKPKVGLTSKQHANVAYEAWVGGLDVVKDDENLTNLRFNKFMERMDETFKARDKAEQETGEKKIYLANITAPYNEMVKRYEYIENLGGEYAMVDIVTVGFSALQSIRSLDKLALHGHRAMHAALTRNPKHGLSMLFLAKISRLAGVDQLHIGTAVGKMHGTSYEVQMIEHEIEDGLIPEQGLNVLTQEWGKIKPVLGVSSGGLHPGLLPKVVNILGNDIVIQFGGGCHGHPDGTRAGAKAIRQAMEATMQGIDLKEYAKKHKELMKAIMKWGY